MKSRKEIMAIVLASPRLQRTIARLAGAQDQGRHESGERARKYFLEIASDYNERWLGIWERALSRLWRAIYDDFVIDQDGIDTIKAISGQMPCVILPCHRSHVDYLLLSYIFHQQKIPLPHVAAGDNMNFWPLGYIFRQSGAFFLRRRFQGDDLYAEVFATYLETLLREGVPIEFFLEGGRSRTGKMIMPKYGMISMILRAYQDKVSDDIALLPVYLGYDRIIEEQSYLSELSGASKTRESLLDVVKHTRIMMHRYGRVYLNFGAPIFLKSYLAAQTKKYPEQAVAEQQAVNRNLGSLVVSEINRVSVATPVALLAAALLCHGGRETTGDLLTKIFNSFHDYIGYRNVKMAPSLALPDKALKAAIQIVTKWACLVHKKNKDGKDGELDLYLLPDDQRLRLEYYKNNIIHHFISMGFFATSVLASSKELLSLTLVRENYIFLKRIFSLEFFMGEDHEGELADALAYLLHLGIMKKPTEGGFWELTADARERLLPWSGLVKSYLESYLAVFNACLQVNHALENEKDQLNYVFSWAQKMYAQGEITRVESISGANYANAMKFLRQEVNINQAGSRAEEKGAASGVVIDKDRLATLQSHLAKFL